MHRTSAVVTAVGMSRASSKCCFTSVACDRSTALQELTRATVLAHDARVSRLLGGICLGHT